eukprot:8739931-Alexandrium_andersonii.AAC.1
MPRKPWGLLRDGDIWCSVAELLDHRQDAGNIVLTVANEATEDAEAPELRVASPEWRCRVARSVERSRGTSTACQLAKKGQSCHGVRNQILAWLSRNQQ